MKEQPVHVNKAQIIFEQVIEFMAVALDESNKITTWLEASTRAAAEHDPFSQ